MLFRGCPPVAFMKQQVLLTTFKPGTEFQRYLEILPDFFNMFERSLPGEVTMPKVQAYGEHPALLFYNPYFSHICATRNLKTLNLPSTIDPRGILAKNKPQHVHYTEDNKVAYMREQRDEGGVVR